MAKTKPIIIPDVPQKEPIHNNKAVNDANNIIVFIWFFIILAGDSVKYLKLLFSYFPYITSKAFNLP